MLWSRKRMDKNQIIELWRGLSPHLVKAMSGQEPAEDGRAEEERSNETNEDKASHPVESRHEKDDVWKWGFKCLLILVTLPGC